jgi:protein-disulfide isomerase
MSRNLKISAILVAVFIAAIAAVAVVAGGGDADTAATTPAQTAPATEPAETADRSTPAVVASDPRTLGREGSSGVTLTEFLDFECESCAAVYPVIEQLRQEYAGRATFNIRYFPIDSHPNARNAAHAVEAAAQQGKLEEMYKRMYETQESWSHRDASQASAFRAFAKEMGLDMREYDAAVASAKTAQRVERDVQAGTALGVQGTPTFFIDELRIEPQSVDELREALDTAIAGQ